MKITISILASVIISTFWTLALSKRLRPKLLGDAIYKRDLETRHVSTQKKIVLFHNFLRSRVKPSASDMLEMTWHQGAAEDAQRWAETCKDLTHDNTTGRWVEEYGSCGQNIFIANMKVPWFFAIKIWYLEHQNFTYGGSSNIPSLVGHYTQMVWYSSHKIGCGFHYCGPDKVKQPYYNYVCNYCPIGNHPDKFDTPYTRGEPCGNCPGQCKYKKLCTNGCEYADLWMNCYEINSTWHQWLCGDPRRERHHACKATCLCDQTMIR
ncbi:cysteine-rich venom protein LEI1-like [Limulus polyphemus]|uniref:Cysteine-rich venom protein LEI1-like n=1 Tax=Limulus polyphemus TaxID=6850 RepID=A0ABM1BH42_LIMPO|nr:cysteine-rich venom protein LEI1-like [Limulus polyphemus]